MSSNTIRAIVVEDERLPRLTLLQKLEDFRPQVEVIDSCDNYDDALQSIVRNRPDLLFLDIQLQGRDSIHLLETLRQSQPLPHVIFTTAYSDRKYLMSAIKLAAVDYLLKPIDKNELALAIAKVTGATRTEPQAEKLTLRTANGRLILDPAEIAYIRADGNYSIITTFTAHENVLVSLATLSQMLDRQRFMRIDRSTIVNIPTVYKLNTLRHRCTLRSDDGTSVEVELSKTGMEALLSEVRQPSAKK